MKSHIIKENPTKTPQNQIRISADSNLRFLPLVYFLPEELIAKCPTLCKLPRKVREILYDDEMVKIVESDVFLVEIQDAAASLAFPHFGFGGWKEHYTGYCPVWKFSYLTGLWAGLLDREVGWNLQTLINFPSSENIPFFTSEYVYETMKRIVKLGISEANLQPILDVVKQFPCDEDFEKRDSNVRKSFLRKWYHTRSKIKMQSYELAVEYGEHEIHDITAPDLAENVEAEDYVGRFKERLSKNDMRILELRAEGFTYEEIAEKLGYKTHSGVAKRMKIIAKAYEEYEEENEYE